ncbi:MAG: DUF2971 domain-containing protein [Roseibacillus sp.]
MKKLLYKYLDCSEGSLKTVSEGSIKFTLLTDFNDPFEASAVPDPIQSDHSFTSHQEIVLNMTIGQLIEESNLHELFEKIFEQAPPDTLRCHFESQKLKDILPEEAWKQVVEATSPQKQNPLESSRQQKVQSQLSEMFGVLCLSSDPESYLMWSHYANKHTGFCVGYDSSDSWFDLLTDCHQMANKPMPSDLPSREFIGNIRKVRYEKKRYSFPKELSLETTFQQFFWKSNNWSYEKEFRVLLPLKMAETLSTDKNANDSIYPHFIKRNDWLYVRGYNRNLIKRVVFGCRCSLGDQRDIRAALAGFEVDYYFAMPSSLDYSVSLTPCLLDEPYNPFDQEVIRHKLISSHFTPDARKLLELE